MKEIAFIGNPNVGKSAWINALSHSKLQIGNWPGVTVEKKEAVVHWDEEYHLIDLPGVYTLNESDNEEKITSIYFKNNRPDLIVQVIDATNMKRSLYLTMLLRELQIPIILLLNFMDEVKKHGIKIDVQKLSRRLQLPIICGSAIDSNTYSLVKEAICQHAYDTVFYYPILEPDDEHQFMELLSYIKRKIQCEESDIRIIFKFSIGLVTNDKQIIKQLSRLLIYNEVIGYQEYFSNWDELRMKAVESIMKYIDVDYEKRSAKTKKIDRILLHPILGLPLFFLLFMGVLIIVFKGSEPWNAFIQYIIQDYLGNLVMLLLRNAPYWLKELLVHGVLYGIGTVLSFVPLMAYLYGAMALLEESGYMARIAFLMDRIMRTFHLSGKSFVAFMLGFGCNVPAIYATRTIESEAMRKKTALLIPFMSCGAKLPVYVLFAGTFFKKQAAFVVVLLYAIGILIALILSFVFHQFEDDQDHVYLMELPLYRMPRINFVIRKIKQEVMNYIRKTMSFVIWVIILMWGISYFPNGTIDDSYLSRYAKPIAKLYEPIGFGTSWKSVASLPGGIIAKESVIGFLGQLNHGVNQSTFSLQKETLQLPYHLMDTIKNSMFLLGSQEEVNVQSSIAYLWHDSKAKIRAFSFMVYLLLSIPCVMTLQALKKEYGWKWMMVSIIYMIIIPYVVCFCLFQGVIFFQNLFLT